MIKFNDKYIAFPLDKNEFICYPTLPTFADTWEEAVKQVVEEIGGYGEGIQVYKIDRIVGRVG